NAAGPIFRSARIWDLHSFCRQILSKRLTIIGAERNVVHAVGGFRIRSRAVSDPLRADHESCCLPRLEGRRARQAEDIFKEVPVRLWICRVKRDVINAGDLRARGRGLLPESAD